VFIRPAAEADLQALTELYNHYIVHTPITFDLEPVAQEQRREGGDVVERRAEVRPLLGRRLVRTFFVERRRRP
jgi:L-amino acid N-acyltransferase YncA